MSDIGERVAAVEKDVEHLKGWEDKQNGHIEAINAKLDRFQWWLVGVLAMLVFNLASIWLRPLAQVTTALK